MIAETWFDIPGYPNYLVSNKANVYGKNCTKNGISNCCKTCNKQQEIINGGITMQQLTQIFQMQQDLQLFLGQDFKSLEIEDRAALIKEYCLHTQIELAELLQELPFLKGWKNYNEMTVEEIAEQMSKARKEAVDVLHFYVNICLLLGFDGDQLHEAYMEKNAENYRRQKEELNKGMRYSYDGAS